MAIERARKQRAGLQRAARGQGPPGGAMACGRHEGSPRKRGTRQPAGCADAGGNAEGSGLGQIPGLRPRAAEDGPEGGGIFSEGF